MGACYLQAVAWFLLMGVFSVLNDALTKILGGRLDPLQVTFFRFFFSSLTLLPFMLYEGKSTFRTHHMPIHSVRGLLLFLGMAPWCYGLMYLPLTMAVTISFTLPIFILLLSSVFLKETIGLSRWFATILGFLGIVLTLRPHVLDFNWVACLLVLSTVFFAALDVLNKKLLTADEGLLTMLFYSAVWTTLLSTPFALLFWTMPTLFELGILVILGAGANLLLFCLLKAFSMADVSSLQPFRYVELLTASVFGWVFFGSHLIEGHILWGAIFIIPATLYIVCFEVFQKKWPKLSIKMKQNRIPDPS